MSAFLENAHKILQVARQADARGLEPSDLNFVVEASGQIHILADPGWSAEGLSARHGAAMSYCLRRSRDHFHVDGKTFGTRCQLTAQRPSCSSRWLIDRPAYLLTA